MSERSYLQHGRRHGVFGSDPIPGLGQIPFALVRTDSDQTVVVGADRAVSMQDGSGGFFFTSDDSLFSNGHTDVGLGDQYGIECHSNGTYMVLGNYFFNGGTATVSAIGYHQLSGGNGASFWLWGRTGAQLGDGWDDNSAFTHISYAEMTNADDNNPAPVFVLPYVNVASGSNPDVAVQTLVLYLGPYAGGIGF